MKSVAMATLATLCIGCVAPGSAIGNLSVRGRLATEAGESLPGREVELVLPAEYGLDGLELVLSKPEDFGHTDQRLSTTSDAGGNFRFDLEIIYHMNFWLIPPLGGFPRQPPPPFILLRLRDLPNEYYAIQTWDGRYKVLSLEGAEIPESSVSRIRAHAEEDPTAEVRGTAVVVEILTRGP